MVSDILNFFLLNEIALYGWPVQIILIVLVIALSLILLFIVRKKNKTEDLYLTRREQTNFLKSILDHSGTSSAIIDSEGIIRYVNFGFEALFNPNELPLIGKNIKDIPQLNKLERYFNKEMASVVPVQGHDDVSYMVKYFTVKDNDQHIMGRFLKMLPDVQNRENALDYDLSHELKTPLHAVLGFSELLKKDDNLTSEQDKLLDKIIYHSKQLDDKIKSIVGSEEESADDGDEISSQTTGKKILVVDDVSINRTLLKLMLKRYGLDVQEASNGEAALNILESWKADTILMDLSMPVMDGIETVKAIRAQKTQKTQPKIIAVTATQRYSRGELKDVGFDDLMQKPFKEEDLLPRLGIEIDENESN
ncbi:response regulator [Rhodohalobacter sp. 8-1]|uniref:response regulator n=1 Tax=Rhodohalobacter sp. 8-1 TaxID=3131972 RepID=UPI0030EC739B